MFRLAILSLICIASTAVSAPIPRDADRPVSLAGSVWEGDGVVAATVYEFHPDGKLTLTYNGNTHKNCGTWKQEGKKIYWETNQQYCEFEGTLIGTTITGHAWNKCNGNWDLTFKRTKAR